MENLYRFFPYISCKIKWNFLLLLYLYHLYTNGAGWNNLSPCTYVMIVEWQDKQDNSSNSSFTETVSNSLTICHNNWQTQTYPTKTKLNVSPYLLPLLNWILKLSGAIPIWGKVTTMSNDNSKTIWWQVWYPLFKGENPWIGRVHASQAVDQSSFFLFFIFFIIIIFIVVDFVIHWRNSHGFTCVPHPDTPSHLPLHPILWARPLKWYHGDFPGGPVAKTLRFHCSGPG